MSDIIKRGTKITPQLLADMLIRIYRNVNQIPTSNMVVSTKQFVNSDGANLEGAYNDSIVSKSADNYLKKYYDYVKLLVDM